MNLIENIYEEYLSDDFDTNKASLHLTSTYHQSTDQQKQAMNSMCIAICGWSLEKLIETVNH